MPITTRMNGSVTVVELGPVLTSDREAREFGDTIRRLFADGLTRIVLNCAGLVVADSGWVGEFMNAAKLAHAHAETIKVVAPKRRRLGLPGFGGGIKGLAAFMTCFAHYDTEADAIASFGGDKA